MTSADNILSSFYKESIEKMKDPIFHAEIQKLISMYAYTGFNPREFQKILAARAPRGKFAEDVNYMCLVFIIRGPKLSKIINTSPPEIKSSLQILKDTYGIHDNLGGVRNTKIVTLGRIASAFPHVVVRLLLKLNLERPAPTYGLPHFMCCSHILVFYKYIDSEQKLSMIKATCMYLINEAKILDITLKYKTKSEAWDKIKKFVYLAMNADLGFSEDNMKSCATEFFENINKYSDEINSAAAEFTQLGLKIDQIE